MAWWVSVPLSAFMEPRPAPAAQQLLLIPPPAYGATLGPVRTGTGSLGPPMITLQADSSTTAVGPHSASKTTPRPPEWEPRFSRHTCRTSCLIMRAPLLETRD